METLAKEITSPSLPFIPRWEFLTDHQNARSGEFETLAFPFLKRLYRTAIILTGSPHLAKDLLHETYLQAWHGYPHFRNDDGFGVWMFRILFDAFRLKRWDKRTLLFRAPSVLRNNDERKWKD